MPYTVIHLGGVAVGASLLLILALHFWFKGRKDGFRGILPIVYAWCHGMLSVLAAAGAWSLLGVFSWLGLWVSQVTGYAALVWGVGGSSPDVTRRVGLVLTDGGYVILLLATVLLIAMFICGKSPRWKVLAAWLSGLSLGLAAGVAGICAIPLASGTNMLGSLFTEAVL